MRDKRFTFVCTSTEYEMLNSLASENQRTRSDMVRLLIREAFGAEVSVRGPIEQILQGCSLELGSQQ